MKLLMHVFHQPFIVTTGLAALLHSTWSLGTLFAGEQPPAGLTVEFVGWLAPALLLAFALDVGQIATSAEIRAGQRTRIKYITFIVFAAATYFLQWIYIAHHMPALLLGEGVRNDWQWMATLIRDAALWIIPAFLPLSTTLYTFSGGNITNQPAPESITVQKSGEKPAAPLPALEPSIKPVAVAHLPEVPPTDTHYRDKWLDPEFWLDDENLDGDFLADKPLEHVAQCKACGWHKPYRSERAAQNALNAHGRHCPRALSVSSNGGGGNVTSPPE